MKDTVSGSLSSLGLVSTRTFHNTTKLVLATMSPAWMPTVVQYLETACNSKICGDGSETSDEVKVALIDAVLIDGVDGQRKKGRGQKRQPLQPGVRA